MSGEGRGGDGLGWVVNWAELLFSHAVLIVKLTLDLLFFKKNRGKRKEEDLFLCVY